MTWCDAHAHAAYWNTPDDLIAIKPIHTLGHYIRHDDHYYTVAQSWGSGDYAELDGFGGCFSIPIGTIRKITTLKENTHGS